MCARPCAIRSLQFAADSSDSCVVSVMRTTESLAERPATRLPRPVVIGHRGAPAYRPEHTAASFELAIDLGADLIEPDVAVSRDGALVVRHENELSHSTDVADRPEFADRRRSEEHTSELQPRQYIVCRLLLGKIITSPV